MNPPNPTGAEDRALPSDRAVVTEADHEIAVRANVLWGEAINGPHVASIAAAMGRREGFLQGLAMAVEMAKAHKPDRILKGQTLSRYEPEDREIIRAEENGEAIAAHVIAVNIAGIVRAADAPESHSPNTMTPPPNGKDRDTL